MILWCKFMNSHKDQTSPQHTQTLGSALASSSSSGSMPLLFLRSLQVLSPHSFPKTYSSSNCKPSFISSAVPALVRGPLWTLSQWRLGAFIFCWRRLTGWRQWSLPGRESSVSVWLFYTLAFRKEGLYLSFYFPRERLPCWPFRKSRAQHLLIPLGERYIISSTRSVFPKQSIMPQRHSWSLRVNFPGPVKWIKWNT